MLILRKLMSRGLPALHTILLRGEVKGKVSPEPDLIINRTSIFLIISQKEILKNIKMYRGNCKGSFNV
jgi:hypothetical protein